MNRRFSMPSCLIFDSNVEGGMPSVAAAPRDPATFPRLFVSAASISFLLPKRRSRPTSCCLSRLTAVSASRAVGAKPVDEGGNGRNQFHGVDWLREMKVKAGS